MASASIQGVRSLRPIVCSPAPIARHISSHQHRNASSSSSSFSQRPAAHGILSLSARPRRLETCPSCLRKRQGHRSFSLAAVVDGPVNATVELITQLHAVTYTPWCITLPLVALGVNLVVRLPFTIHARRLMQKRSELAPLLQAWTTVHIREVLKERQQPGQARVPQVDIQAESIKRSRKTFDRVFRTFGLQQWKLYSNFLALPPWLLVIEAIRRMCGAPVGLLGLIFRRGAGSSKTVGAAASATPDVADVASTTLADTASAATDAGSATASALDPSLAAGGCLWFPDLTVPDPYCVLPFALSALLVANVLPSSDAGRRQLFGLPPRNNHSGHQPGILTTDLVTNALQRVLLIVAVAAGPITLALPSAIHVYWLASAGSSFLLTRAVRRLMPTDNRMVALSPADMAYIQPPPPTVASAAPPRKA